MSYNVRVVWDLMALLEMVGYHDWLWERKSRMGPGYTVYRICLSDQRFLFEGYCLHDSTEYGSWIPA